MNYYALMIYNFFPVDFNYSRAIAPYRQMFPVLANLLFFASLFLRVGFFSALLCGIYKVLKQKIDMVDWLTFFYILFIVLWPPRTGFRYLLPIFPIIMIYAAQGIMLLKPQVRKIPIIFAACIILPVYLSGNYVLTSSDKQIDGPQTPEANEAFETVKNLTSDSAVVVFWKPRVMALYGERRSLVHDLSLDHSKLKTKYRTDCDTIFFLYDKIMDRDENHYQNIKKADSADLQAITAIWENARFVLYKRNK